MSDARAPHPDLDHLLGVARAALGTQADVDRLRGSLSLPLSAANEGAALLPKRTLVRRSLMVGGGSAVIAGVLWLSPLLRAPVPAVVVAPVLVQPAAPVVPVQPPTAAPAPMPIPEPHVAGAWPAHKRAPATASALEHAPRESDDPATEVVLLTQAHALIVKQPLAAIVRLDEHAQRFANGVLSEERDALRVQAELSLGGKARVSAYAHARAFVQRYPRSAHRRRFEQLLENVAPDHNTEPTSRHTP